MYRKGIYNHIRQTHRVAVAEGARIYPVPAESNAAIIHFNQDNLFEYLEKMNRYTETYVTRFPTPQSAEDIYNFALNKILAAKQTTLAQSDSPYDAVCDLVTAIYYTVEYLKQWERDRGLSVDEHYAQTVRNIFDFNQ